GCDVIVVMASGILGFLRVEQGQDIGEIIGSILSPILYSAISLVVCAEVADIIQSGLKSSIVFNVISDKHNEIAASISEKLHRGVTMVHATGWYTGVDHDMLVCVVRKKQINQVNDIIKNIDPEAFVYITKAKDVSGRGFTYHTPA
ncbi:MAG: YitT family protein, partial [Clostridia bacterium]|nr:YitT family protein [Clostridia bacterium]